MIDYEKVLLDLVTPMVEDKTNVSVKMMPTLEDNEILLYVYANSDDVARLTFHRDRRNRCGFFHFLNMNFQLKAAALQKFLQQMLILDRPVAFLLIQNLIDKIFLFIDGRQ